MTTDISTEITQKFIDAIEGGTLDGKWVMPWNQIGSMPLNPTKVNPHTGLKGKPYQGVNALLLMLMGGDHFAGYGQWKNMGAQVRKGEKGIMILAPVKFKTGNKTSKGDDEYFVKGFRPVKVFAASQVDGYEVPAPADLTDVQHTTAVDAIIARMGLEVRYGGDRAFYVPSQDYIQMPLQGQFESQTALEAVTIHEQGHATGHASRLDRELNTTRFGDEAYAFEELIAELTASFVCAELGIHNGFQDNHAKYIKSWLKTLKGDSKAIMTAAASATVAADVLMGRVDMKGKAFPKDKGTDAIAA
jgi:antirestriction protein ArdC